MTSNAYALITDSFGGRGGIALYNRHFLQAVCSYPGFSGCEALPRVITYHLEAMPANLVFRSEVAGSKTKYALAAARLAMRHKPPPIVFCGHLHLLPLAHMLGLRYRCPVVPLIYGVEAWQPTGRVFADRLCRGLEDFIGIRKLTADRFRKWTGTQARFHYLPNCIDLSRYGAAPKRHDLVARYGLEGQTVIMTTGRLENSALEINKGFDEVLETLPLLQSDLPELRYLIMGDGDDRSRLEEKARSLGVADRVVFTGYVPETEKRDHYCLADVVAMPGSHPAFDTYPFRFAFLEPLACGVPAVGTRLEDESERNDPDARQLIVQVDPHDPADIRRGILEAIARRGDGIDRLPKKFAYEAFEARAHEIISDVLERARRRRSKMSS